MPIMAIVTHFKSIFYSIKFYQYIQYPLNFALLWEEERESEREWAQQREIWLPSDSGELNLCWIRYALRKSITVRFKLKLTKWKWTMLKCFDSRELFFVFLFYLILFLWIDHTSEKKEIHRNLNMAPFQSISLRLNYIHSVEIAFDSQTCWILEASIRSCLLFESGLQMLVSRIFLCAFILPFNQINEIILKCVHLHSLNGFIKLNATKSKSTNDTHTKRYSLQPNEYIEQH